MTHSEKCVRNFADYRKDLEEYNNKYPNHCEHCKGRGGFMCNYDPSPAGVSLSPGYMTEFEPCAECLGNCQCPRCLALIGAEGESCPSCNWMEGVNGEPEPAECFCWEEQEGQSADFCW